jgi:glutamate--cysteine ligase
LPSPFYDQASLDAAWDIVKHWSLEEREALRDSVPKLGLKAPVPQGRTLGDIAPEILDIATAGLSARGRLNGSGDNESGFLDPLREIVASGKTPAERLLERYHGVWNGDVSKVYEEESF